MKSIKLDFLKGFVLCNFLIRYASCWTMHDVLPVTYNPQLAPRSATGPIQVKIGIHVVKVLSVNEADSTMSLDLFYNISWTDHRLQALPHNKNNIIILDSEWKSKLWIPDVYFRNSLSITILNFIKPVLYFEIRDGIHVKMIVRMIGKYDCEMNLFHYPQDTQECTVDIVSLTQTTDDLQLIWESFDVNDQLYMANCFVKGSKTGNCSKKTSRGDFSCLRGSIKFSRLLSYYMLRIYGPSFLVVVISFVGFWIPVLAWPARVAVVVTPLLTLITMQTQMNAQINVSYVVALHIWMMSCIFFNFMCLVEYILAISFAYHIEDHKAIHRNTVQSLSFGNECSSLKQKTLLGLRKIFGSIDWKVSPLNRNLLDYLSRIAFPMLFAFFVLIYVVILVIPPLKD